MRRRTSPPGQIGDILSKALEQWNLKSKLKRYELFEDWKNMVGDTLATRSAPLRFQGDCLIVGVDHPAWVQEMNLLKETLLKKIREKFPGSGVRKVRFILK